MESMTGSVQSMSVNLPRFGVMTYAESDVIELPWGLPGFPALHRWLLLTLDTQSSFVWLQSLDDLGVAIPTANPWMIFEEYDPKMPPYAFMALDVREASEFTLLCVVVVAPGAREMTINLAAPILVNLRTRKARQIPLESNRYSIREPIPRKAVAARAEPPAKAS